MQIERVKEAKKEARTIEVVKRELGEMRAKLETGKYKNQAQRQMILDKINMLYAEAKEIAPEEVAAYEENVKRAIKEGHEKEKRNSKENHKYKKWQITFEPQTTRNYQKAIPRTVTIYAEKEIPAKQLVYAQFGGMKKIRITNCKEVKDAR